MSQSDPRLRQLAEEAAGEVIGGLLHGQGGEGDFWVDEVADVIEGYMSLYTKEWQGHYQLPAEEGR